MTNKKKQSQKSTKNTVKRETARFTFKKHQPELSPDEISAINQFPEMLDKKFGELKNKYDLTNNEMYDLLAPYLSGANIVSKIGVPPGCRVADPRHVNLKLMVAMCRVFGISIDELLDECFQSLPDRQPPQK